MPKSRNTTKKGDHKKRVERFKINMKREQEALKKRMLDNYIRLQKEALEKQEAHTSTQEVVGPEINIDELNQVEDWVPMNEIVSSELSETNIVESIVESDVKLEEDVNNNQ